MKLFRKRGAAIRPATRFLLSNLVILITRLEKDIPLNFLAAITSKQRYSSQLLH